MDRTSTNALSAPWETAEFLDLVMQAAPNGLAVVDADGRILYANRALADMFGYAIDEMMQAPVETIIPERLRDRHVEYRRGFMAAPAARAMGAGRDLFGLRKDGSEFPVEIGLSPLRVADQMFVLASVIDITVRKQTEKTAQIHARRVEAVNKELAAYTSAISHDLRAPLRAVRNYVNFLREDIGPGLGPKPKRYLDALGAAVHQADRMILDLLILGRLDAPGMPPVAIDLGELFAEIRRSLDLPKDVHFITTPQWPDIEAPRVLLLHIFQNLIGNAVKFNTSSSKRVEIGWRSAEEGNVEFYVKDNGIGIDPLYHDRAFDVFERLNPPGQYEGAGLGLALVKKAVDVLDGRIRVESQPNKGSTFFVTIPKRRYPNE